ncbi:MAG: DUF3842 family protein [Bulleidia sp.]
MKILVIDGQGGGIGKALVSAMKSRIPEAEIIAVGTNSTAAQAMLKAGADHAASGENSVIVCARNADYIVGPIGIVIADAMYGEITSAMAAAIGRSDAKRILIPMHHCDNTVAGVEDYSISHLVDETVNLILADRKNI